MRILIAGCDTFRSGAIEQLKTHVSHLNNIFNEKNAEMIELYSRGYGKDPAGIAAEAINYGKNDQRVEFSFDSKHFSFSKREKIRCCSRRYSWSNAKRRTVDDRLG